MRESVGRVDRMLTLCQRADSTIVHYSHSRLAEMHHLPSSTHRKNERWGLVICKGGRSYKDITEQVFEKPLSVKKALNKWKGNKASGLLSESYLCMQTRFLISRHVCALYKHKQASWGSDLNEDSQPFNG